MASFYFGSDHDEFIADFPSLNNVAHTDHVDELRLGILPTDILEGVMQRLPYRTKGKGFMERVNRRFATVAHRLAWRHRHTLKIKYSPAVDSAYYDSDDDSADHPAVHSAYNSRVEVGPFFVDWGEAAAAARFLIARSTIHHVEFDVNRGEICYRESVLPVELCQEPCRGILAALLSSNRVALRSLDLHWTTDEVFGGSDQLAALIRRHSAKLQEAGVFLHDGQPATCVADALTGCPVLRKLTVFVDDWQAFYNKEPPSWEGTALVDQLQLSSLTFNGAGFPITTYTCATAAILPLAPQLTELRFKNFGNAFDDRPDWSPLADVRLFEGDWENLLLDDYCAQAEVNRVFSDVLPSLCTLIINNCYSCTSVYWGLLTKLVSAFLNRAGDASLAVELPVECFNGQPWRRPLTEWHTAFPELSVEYFGVPDGVSAAATRPVLPKEFEHAAESEVFVLGRPNEARRITIAVWKYIH